MKEIDEFVNKYNALLKCKFPENQNLKLVTKVLSGDNFIDEINYFLNAFDFNSVEGFYWFYRGEPFKVPANFVWLASNIDYNLEYIFDTRTKEVCLWDSTYEEIEWKCSKNLGAFFQSMCIVLDVQIEICKTKNFDLDNSYLKEKYDHCISVNDNRPEYFEFYEQIIGVEL